MKIDSALIAAVCCCLYGMGMADETAPLAPAGETEGELTSSPISPEWKSKTIHEAKDGKVTYQVEDIDIIDIKVQQIPDNQIIDALRAYEFLFMNNNDQDVPQKLEKYLNQTFPTSGAVQLALESPTHKEDIDCKGKKEGVLSLEDLYGGKLEKGLYQVHAGGIRLPKKDSPQRPYRMKGLFVLSTILVRVGDLKVEQSVEADGGLKASVSSRSTPERKIEASIQYLDENGKKMGPEIPAGEVMPVQDGMVPSFIKVTTPQETFVDWVSR